MPGRFDLVSAIFVRYERSNANVNLGAEPAVLGAEYNALIAPVNAPSRLGFSLETQPQLRVLA